MLSNQEEALEEGVKGETMKTVTAKEPLVKKRLVCVGLILTFALFGLVSFAGQRILSTMILQK